MKMRVKTKITMVAVCAASLWLPASGVASACTTKTVCVRFPVVTDDLVVGDLPAFASLSDLSSGFFPATGARSVFIPPAPEPARSVVLDEQGCFSFESEYWTGFKLLVYPDAYLGENADIHLQVFDNYADLNTAQFFPEDPAVQKPWLVHINGVTANDVVYAEISGSWEAASMFAIASYVIQRIDGLTDGLAGATLYAYTGDTTGDSYSAGGGYAFSENLYLNHKLVSKKFTIAHELGHWFGLNWGAGNAFLKDYDYSSQDAACKFAAVGSNSDHGLRTSELGGTGYNEGFAQFIAAQSFDDASTSDAIFKYYKEIDLDKVPDYYDLVVEDQLLVSLIGGNPDALGGQSAWVRNECVDDWDEPVEISSEIDWMRLLWQFLYSDVVIEGEPTPKPSLAELVELVSLPSSSDGTGYAAISGEVCDPANAALFVYCDRFEELVATNGVDNGA